MEYPCHSEMVSSIADALQLRRSNLANSCAQRYFEGTVAEQGLQLRNRAMAAADEGIMITDATQTGNPIIYANSGFYESPDTHWIKCWDAIVVSPGTKD